MSTFMFQVKKPEDAQGFNRVYLSLRNRKKHVHIFDCRRASHLSYSTLSESREHSVLMPIDIGGCNPSLESKILLHGSNY